MLSKEIKKPRKKIVKVKEKEKPTFEDIMSLKMMVKVRDDFQKIRIKLDNRLGVKANGEQQDIPERIFDQNDFYMFEGISGTTHLQEKLLEDMLIDSLKKFPIYNRFLKNIDRVGNITSGWIIAEFNIEKATTVSKMWQFAGLNAALVRGKKDIEAEKYKPSMGEIIKEYEPFAGNKRIIYKTNEMIRGDKLHKEFTSPFNQNLRRVLLGILATGFITGKSKYALDYYYPYKARLEQEESKVMHIGKMVAWKDVSDGHRHNAAKRYMIKMFIKDLYVAWRTIEGLPVRESYQEEYLGHKHAM